MSCPMYVIGIWPGFAQIGVYFTSKSYNSDRKAVKDLFDTYYLFILYSGRANIYIYKHSIKLIDVGIIIWHIQK